MGIENPNNGGAAKGGTNDLVEKFRATSVGEKVILIAGPVLFIIGFFSWYSANTCVELLGESVCGGGSASAWDAPGALWSILAILIGLAMSAVVVIRNLSPGTIPDNVSGITWPRILLGAASAAALFLLIKLINHSGDLAIGFFLGILCVAALVVGGFFMYREEQGKPIV